MKIPNLKWKFCATVADKGQTFDFYFSVSDFQSRISKIIISKSLVNHTNIYLGSAVSNTA